MLEYLHLHSFSLQQNETDLKSTRTLQFHVQIMSHSPVFPQCRLNTWEPGGRDCSCSCPNDSGGSWQSNQLSWSRPPAIAGSSWGQPVVFSGDTFIVGLRSLQSACQSLCWTCVVFNVPCSAAQLSSKGPKAAAAPGWKKQTNKAVKQENKRQKKNKQKNESGRERGGHK